MQILRSSIAVAGIVLAGACTMIIAFFIGFLVMFNVVQ